MGSEVVISELLEETKTAQNFDVEIDLRPLYKAELPILVKLLDFVSGVKAEEAEWSGLMSVFGKREVYHSVEKDEMVATTYTTVTRLVQLAEKLGQTEAWNGALERLKREIGVFSKLLVLCGLNGDLCYRGGI